jgi:hypothetical protein
LKAKVIAGYGGKCECCGDDHPEFLTIDHVEGSGASHRKSLRRTFYVYLIEAGFPKDKFRLLCMNCNFAFGKFGYCPHNGRPFIPSA